MARRQQNGHDMGAFLDVERSSSESSDAESPHRRPVPAPVQHQTAGRQDARPGPSTATTTTTPRLPRLVTQSDTNLRASVVSSVEPFSAGPTLVGSTGSDPHSPSSHRQSVSTSAGGSTLVGRHVYEPFNQVRAAVPRSTSLQNQRMPPPTRPAVPLRSFHAPLLPPIPQFDQSHPNSVTGQIALGRGRAMTAPAIGRPPLLRNVRDAASRATQPIVRPFRRLLRRRDGQ